MNPKKSNSVRKIVIMGLNNAGKSSIALNLRGKKDLLSHLSLNPTEDHQVINTEIMNTEFNFLDLSGQKEYRTEHLSNISRYLEHCDKLIYVIDIQDKKRYELALDYLEKIIDKIKVMEPSLDLSIFFHKYDPGIKEKHPSIQNKLKYLINEIKEIIPSKIPFEVFKTTIYTIFEKNPMLV
mgnify:CR=1 FL=1